MVVLWEGGAKGGSVYRNFYAAVLLIGTENVPSTFNSDSEIKKVNGHASQLNNEIYVEVAGVKEHKKGFEGQHSPL